MLDPVLVAELATAGPDDPVAALILVQGAWRRALAADESGSILSPDSELTKLIERARSGVTPPEPWKIELYPELGALYVRAPAAALARLLTDPGVASATLPDDGP